MCCFLVGVGARDTALGSPSGAGQPTQRPAVPTGSAQAEAGAGARRDRELMKVPYEGSFLVR